MCDEAEIEDWYIMSASANLFSYVRSLIKDEKAVITIVRESLEAMYRAKIQGEANIRSFLKTTARNYSLNFLKQERWT